MRGKQRLVLLVAKTSAIVFSLPVRSLNVHLTEARRLIEKHGYWRRKGELEEAEAVIK